VASDLHRTHANQLNLRGFKVTPTLAPRARIPRSQGHDSFRHSNLLGIFPGRRAAQVAAHDTPASARERNAGIESYCSLVCANARSTHGDCDPESISFSVLPGPSVAEPMVRTLQEPVKRPSHPQETPPFLANECATQPHFRHAIIVRPAERRHRASSRKTQLLRPARERIALRSWPSIESGGRADMTRAHLALNTALKPSLSPKSQGT
jgi:hypothetical protein